MAVTILGKVSKNFQSLSWKKMLPYFGASAVILVMMVLSKAASFLWRLILLRYDVSFLGEIELFSTTLGLAVTFSTLAFPEALIRFSLRKKAKAQAYFYHSFVRTFQAFLVVGAAIWVLSRFGTIFTPNTQLPLGLFLGVVLLSVGQRVSLAYLNSQKRFALYGLGEYVLTPVLKLLLLLAILLGLFGKSFLFFHVVWSVALARLIIIILTFWKKNSQPAVSLAEPEKREFLAYSLLLSGSFLAFMVYGALDVYLLQYFFNSTTVGIYAGMLTFINLMELVFLPFLHTFPAHLAERKSQTAKIRFTTATAQILVKIGLILGVSLALFGIFFLPVLSNNILHLPFGVLLAFAVFKTLHYGLVHVYRHYLDFQGEQAFTAKTMFASLGLKAALCLLLVPSGAIAGLAVANIITDLFHSWLLWRRIRSSR